MSATNENSLIALCGQYAGAESSKQRDRAVRDLRYALEGVGPISGSLKTVERVWDKVREDGQLDESEANAVLALLRGHVALHQKQTKQARQHFSQTHELADKINRGSTTPERTTRDEIATHLQCLAWISDAWAMCEQGEYELVLQQFPTMESKCDSLHVPSLSAELAHVAGLAYRRKGDPEESFSILNRARDLYESAGDRLGAARAEDTLGMTFLDQGNFDEAMFHFQRSLARKSALGDKQGLAITSGNIGRLYIQFEEFDKAAEFLDHGLSLSHELGDQYGQHVALINLAEVALARGDIAASARLLSDAEKLGGVLTGDSDARARTLFARSSHLIAERDYELAMDFHRKARELFGRISTPLMAAELDLQEGIIESGRRNFGRARECFNGAINGFRSIKRSTGVARAHFECAMLLLHQGLFDDAALYLVQAVDQARDLAAVRMSQRFQQACERVGSEVWIRTVWQMKQLNERIKEQEAIRESAVSLIAHDIKNILWGIDESIKPPLVPEKLNVALKNAHRQYRLCIDLLSSMTDASRLESGEVYLKKDHVFVRPIMRELIEWFRPNVREDIALKEASENEDVAVIADETSLRRTLLNFLHNAKKYTVPRETPMDEGGHTGMIILGVRRAGPSARIWVQDTGPGIPAEFLERIFAKFGQVQPGMKKGSSGLGLYFCKLAVEAQGGEIGVDSTVGEGSTFWFTLPIT